MKIHDRFSALTCGGSSTFRFQLHIDWGLYERGMGGRHRMDFGFVLNCATGEIVSHDRVTSKEKPYIRVPHEGPRMESIWSISSHEGTGFSVRLHGAEVTSMQPQTAALQQLLQVIDALTFRRIAEAVIAAVCTEPPDAKPARPDPSLTEPAKKRRIWIEEETLQGQFQEVLIPAGGFRRAWSGEEVTLTRALYVMDVPVTQTLHHLVKPFRRRVLKRDRHLPEITSWVSALNFANAFSRRVRLEPVYAMQEGEIVWKQAASGYRLPTEAEWEYAARGGEDHPYAGSDDPLEVGWFEENASGKLHAVRQKKPNGYGLCDMSGNAWEWCWDWHAPHTRGPQVDPVGPERGTHRVIRGGTRAEPVRRLPIDARRYANPRDSHGVVRLVRWA